MTQLEKLKLMLSISDTTEDGLLELCLDFAKEIICNIRYTTDIEPEYLNVQIRIALEIYNKMGAEGQTSHSENGVSRTYESGDISPSILAQIPPVVKTPYSVRKVVNAITE